MVIRSEAKKPCHHQRMTVQTLGEFTYAIPDPAPKKIVNKAATSLVAILLFPLLILFFIIWTALMYLGPSSVRNALLSRMIPSVMNPVKKRTINQRRLLLQHVSGRVLDVGSGGGAYLSVLKGKASHVVALEPVETLHEMIKKEAARVGLADYQITVSSESVEAYAAANPNVTFDWVIFGNVLCEVDDIESTLVAADKLLRPGGHVYFSEHLGACPRSCTRIVQDIINPWWRRVSGGCNCNRDSLHAIEGMIGWEVASWMMTHMSVWGGPFVMGLARKVQTSP